MAAFKRDELVKMDTVIPCNSVDVVFILKSRGFGRGSQVTRQYINMFGSTINPEIH